MGEMESRTAEVKPFQQKLDDYKEEYAAKYLAMMLTQLGLLSEEVEDQSLVEALTEVLQLIEMDMTIFSRSLADLPKEIKVNEAGTDFLAPVPEAFYQPEELTGEILSSWRNWLTKYLTRLGKETALPTRLRREGATETLRYASLINYASNYVGERCSLNCLPSHLRPRLKKPHYHIILRKRLFRSVTMVAPAVSPFSKVMLTWLEVISPSGKDTATR